MPGSYGGDAPAETDPCKSLRVQPGHKYCNGLVRACHNPCNAHHALSMHEPHLHLASLKPSAIGQQEYVSFSAVYVSHIPVSGLSLRTKEQISYACEHCCLHDEAMRSFGVLARPGKNSALGSCIFCASWPHALPNLAMWRLPSSTWSVHPASPLRQDLTWRQGTLRPCKFTEKVKTSD